MSRTIRKNSPKLIHSIHRNRALDTHGLWSWKTRKDDKILRGQDGAIRYDKCQPADLDKALELQRERVTQKPRDSASVVVVRPHPDKVLEVLLLRRDPKSEF